MAFNAVFELSSLNGINGFVINGIDADDGSGRSVSNAGDINGDGIDDNLTISYTLAESDYLLRIRIFDRYGRHIRTLVDGVDAGISGTEVWDGLDDSGNRNRIGYYIIYFEAFNSASGANVTLKKTVVLARRL